MSARHEQATGHEPLFTVTLYKMFSCHHLSLLLHLLSWNCFFGLIGLSKCAWNQCRNIPLARFKPRASLKICVSTWSKIKNNNKFNRKVLIFGLWLHSYCWWWWQLEGFFVYSYYIPQCDIIIWLGLGPRPSQDEFTRGGWSADQLQPHRFRGHESSSRELRLDRNSTLEGPTVCSTWGRRSWWVWLVAVIVAAVVL